nr:uncharacterized protein LOC106680659 [Halyomorpha halys]
MKFFTSTVVFVCLFNICISVTQDNYRKGSFRSSNSVRRNGRKTEAIRKLYEKCNSPKYQNKVAWFCPLLPNPEEYVSSEGDSSEFEQVVNIFDKWFFREIGSNSSKSVQMSQRYYHDEDDSGEVPIPIETTNLDKGLLSRNMIKGNKRPQVRQESYEEEGDSGEVPFQIAQTANLDKEYMSKIMRKGNKRSQVRQEPYEEEGDSGEVPIPIVQTANLDKGHLSGNMRKGNKRFQMPQMYNEEEGDSGEMVNIRKDSTNSKNERKFQHSRRKSR